MTMKLRGCLNGCKMFVFETNIYLYELSCYFMLFYSFWSSHTFCIFFFLYAFTMYKDKYTHKFILFSFPIKHTFLLSKNRKIK